LLGTRNPHVLEYIPVSACRAPCASSRSLIDSDDGYLKGISKRNAYYA
jgi:hypothetical protein